jgi:hypothetical protein
MVPTPSQALEGALSVHSWVYDIAIFSGYLSPHPYFFLSDDSG